MGSCVAWAGFTCGGTSPQRALATHLKIPVQRVNEIVKGKRGVSPDTAWLLADAFGTSPEFWSNLQTVHDLSLHRPERHVGPLVSVER